MTARRLNWVLAVLLALMTVLAFLSAGAATWMWRHPGAVMAASQALETYPPSLRRAIRAEYAASRGEVRGDVERLDAARRHLFELLRAEPLDEPAIRAAMKDVREIVFELQETGQEHLLDVMRKADPAERARITIPSDGFADRLGRIGN